MIVFIAGMPRSGSTFSFNVARDLLRRRGTIYQEVSASIPSTIERSGDAEHVLCKAHNADDATLRLAELGAVKVVCTVRKPEDAIASRMECFGLSLDECIGGMQAWLDMFERLRSCSLIVRYEQIDHRPRYAALRIAQHLGFDYSTEEIDAIASKYVKRSVINMTNGLKVDDAEVKHLDYSYYHRETFFHRRHISSLVSRQAADVIGEHTIPYIREIFQSCTDDRGDLWWVEGELTEEIKAALSLITPMKVLAGLKVRVGGKHDGGYVMIDDIEGGGICYSFGVGPDISWDLDMAERGWIVYQYDHTVDEPPSQHPNCHFHQIGLAPIDDAPNMKRLDTLVGQNGHLDRADMILKMDIEGNEWECLDCLEDCFLGRFQQIVIEIHWMDHLILSEFRSRFNRVMDKIHRTHECVHIHANNYSKIIETRGIPIAEVYELTLARCRDYTFVENDEDFPSELDTPNDRTSPDYYLGLFKFE